MTPEEARTTSQPTIQWLDKKQPAPQVANSCPSLIDLCNDHKYAVTLGGRCELCRNAGSRILKEWTSSGRLPYHPGGDALTDEKTRFLPLAGEGWQVWKAQTANSVYHVAISTSGRRMATLSRLADRPELLAEDSHPLVGDALLFDIEPENWVGKRLSIGHIETSVIESVIEEPEQAYVTIVARLSTRVHPPATQLTRTRGTEGPSVAPPSYPENYVLALEHASRQLRAAMAAVSLTTDLKESSDLHDRFTIALGECALSIEGLRRRAARDRD